MFQAIRKHFAFLGVHPLQQGQQNVFNIKNVMSKIILADAVILTNVYPLCKSIAFNEYVGSFWVTCCFTSAFVNFVMLVLHTPNVFDFMVNFELIIQKSK